MRAVKCGGDKSLLDLSPLVVALLLIVSAAASLDGHFEQSKILMPPTCIYPGPHSETFSPEHYLPIALGRFEGMEPLQNRICTGCNNELGRRVETQFLRAGPTGFFRWMIGIRGRDGLPPSPFHRAAAGADPMYIVGRAPDWPFELLWEAEPGTENVCPLRQIIFHHPLIGYRAIGVLERFRERPDDFRDHLREQGLENATPIHVFATEDEAAWMGTLLEGLGRQPPQEWTRIDVQQQRIELVTTVTVTEAYFRAIAKIAFHYLLKMYPDLTGFEREFDDIKEFIWNGGNVERFVVQRRDQFIANFRLGYRPTNWMHVLASERARGRITVYSQFFVGPRSLPLPYEIKIGRDPARIHTNRQRYAHEYVILEASADNAPRGVMQNASPTNYVLIPRMG